MINATLTDRHTSIGLSFERTFRALKAQNQLEINMETSHSTHLHLPAVTHPAPQPLRDLAGGVLIFALFGSVFTLMIFGPHVGTDLRADALFGFIGAASLLFIALLRVLAGSWCRALLGLASLLVAILVILLSIWCLALL